MGREKKRLSTADDVIAELNSGYGDSLSGPRKEINGVVLESAETDAPNNGAQACIGVKVFYQDLYGAMRDETKQFRVSLDALGHLAETAPRLRPRFSKMFSALSTRLKDEQAAWCDAGLPAQEGTVLMKPLRWKTAAGT